MSGRILIIDTVATNRIVLKVKMHAAQYAVDTCGGSDEALQIIGQSRPDLILLNLSDPVEDRHAFCHDLKADPDTSDIPIIALGIADTCRARFAALDAGADEVMPRPADDTLLLARIRSLLRMRHANAELWLRDGTSRALGFEEASNEFAHAAKVAVLTSRRTAETRLIAKLNAAFTQKVRMLDTETVLTSQGLEPVPDLFVIDASEMRDNGRAMFRLVADLRSRNETRLSTQLVVVPREMADIAAMALDLGADDVVFSHVAAAELALRSKVLIARKWQQDKLRDTVRSGMHAAVTDPLTGLYNRRYAEPYLARMAEQAKKLGQDFAVMILDIDHFKTINDRFGHAAGDAVLKQLSDRLRQNLRAVDLVARIGGEEFLIAMPNTSADQAEAAADRLRRIVNGKLFDLGADQDHLRVTTSIGVAVGGICALDDQSSAQICTQADAALYAAKSGGRDQVSLATAPVAATAAA